MLVRLEGFFTVELPDSTNPEVLRKLVDRVGELYAQLASKDAEQRLALRKADRDGE